MRSRSADLKILHVSTADLEGGAEKAALDLHTRSLAEGVTSSMCVGRRTLNLESVWELPNDDLRNRWARQWLRATAGIEPVSTRPGRYLRGLRWVGEPKRWFDIHRGREDFDFPASLKLLRLAPFSPSIVHLHNLHGGYFDLGALPALSARVPVSITLHDSWLLSGHCAQSFDCERWVHGCGSCPDLDIYPGVLRDETAFNWERKRDLLSRSRLHICTASQWMMDRVKRSIVAAAAVDMRVIPYGIDLDVFTPGDRARARDRLGLPQDSKVLLFVGNAVRSNQFKDFRTLARALEVLGMQATGCVLVCVGGAGESTRIGEVEVRFVDRVSDQQVVAEYYRASDVYVHPARAEAFGLSVTEAQACGIPVVATTIGGIPEQVIDASEGPSDDATGFLVPPVDPPALASSLARLLEDELLRARMGENARRHVEGRYGLDRYVSDTLDWYEEILSKNQPDAPFGDYSEVST